MGDSGGPGVLRRVEAGLGVPYGVSHGVLGCPVGCWGALLGVGVPYGVSHGVSGCPMGCWGTLLGAGVPYGVSHGVLGCPLGYRGAPWGFWLALWAIGVTGGVLG